MTVSSLDNYTTTYSYDRNNRLLTETKDSGDALTTVNYAYDANGNQLSKVGGTLNTSIGNPVVVGLSVLGQSEDSGLIAEINTYNAFNQLTQVQTARHSVSYAYKADGLRTSKTSNGQTTSFVWDGSNIAAENRGGDYQTYTRGIGLIRNGAGEYYLFDAHGDVVQMAGAGGVVREYKYDAFGNEVEPDEDDTNPFRYCGEYWDAETGTVYLRNRSYNPINGRFSAEDPIMHGLNWYTYCNNNPIKFIDPLGLAPGDLLVNERTINNTRIINDETYGSLRDFINAIGGSVNNNGNGKYTFNVGKQSFQINTSSFTNGQMQSIKVGKTTINFTKVSTGNGYSQVLANMQDMVDLVGSDKAKRVSYDLGSKGGTYYGYRNTFLLTDIIQTIIIPTELVRQNSSDFSSQPGDAFSSSIDAYEAGTILGGLLENYLSDKQFRSQANSTDKPFMFITEHSNRTGVSMNDQSNRGIHAQNDLRCYGNIVGKFYYGEYH